MFRRVRSVHADRDQWIRVMRSGGNHSNRPVKFPTSAGQVVLILLGGIFAVGLACELAKWLLAALPLLLIVALLGCIGSAKTAKKLLTAE